MIRRISRLIPIIGFIISIGPVTAQEAEPITLENLWLRFSYFPNYWSADARHMADGMHFSVLEDNTINLYNYESGEMTSTLVPADTFGDLEVADFTFSADEKKILIETESQRIYRHSSAAYFYVYDLQTGKLTPVSDNKKGKQRLAEFSPDGSRVAFVRNNDLFWTDLESGKETQVTGDGEKNAIINGTCDWVYEEEFSFTKGFQWSPDGKYIAYYRFDESEVKEWNMTIYGELYPEQRKFKYPKAGEDNSKVSIHIYNAFTGEVSNVHSLENKDSLWVFDRASHDATLLLQEPHDFYIPRIKWTYSGKLAVLRLNRLQNDLQILLADPVDGKTEKLYREKNERYLEITDDLYFLRDNSGFVLTSETDGYNHIYYYGMDGALKARLTKGNYDVMEIKGVDEGNGLVYYIAAESSPLNREICAVSLNGKGKKTVSGKAGNWDAEFNADYTYYFGSWSDANTPPVFGLYTAKGKLLRTEEDNGDLREKLSAMDIPKQEFFSLTTSEGISLNASVIKPNDFDESNAYPVLMYVYGGPNSQTVENIWDPFNGMWFRMLAEKGYVVVSVDGRGTGARGEEFRKVTYQQLGKYETIDQVEAAIYLGAQPWVNSDRIGIFGWSYGGYMTTLCMTKGADHFSTGIAVAPVTNWRFYDNIYTERYMRTPQENPDGYDDNSPINHVDKLRGNYLLVHGTADDNVHIENAYELVNSLVNNNKQFEMQFYPNRNHGIFGGYTRYHLYTRMTDFLFENL